MARTIRHFWTADTFGLPIAIQRGDSIKEDGLHRYIWCERIISATVFLALDVAECLADMWFSHGVSDLHGEKMWFRRVTDGPVMSMVEYELRKDTIDCLNTWLSSFNDSEGKLVLLPIVVMHVPKAFGTVTVAIEAIPPDSPALLPKAPPKTLSTTVSWSRWNDCESVCVHVPMECPCVCVGATLTVHGNCRITKANLNAMLGSYEKAVALSQYDHTRGPLPIWLTDCFCLPLHDLVQFERAYEFMDGDCGSYGDDTGPQWRRTYTITANHGVQIGYRDLQFDMDLKALLFPDLECGPSTFTCFVTGCLHDDSPTTERKLKSKQPSWTTPDSQVVVCLDLWLRSAEDAPYALTTGSGVWPIPIAHC